MENRKLIRLGNSSFAVALPKDWVEKAGLKKGDNVFIERNSSGELIVMPHFKKINGEKFKFLDFSNVDDEKVIKREISVAYVQDYNKIEIKGVRDRKKQAKIREQLNFLMGLEIIEDSNGKLVAKDFFDLSEVNMENFVRRIDNNIRSMFDELGVGIKIGKLNQQQFSEIYSADEDINKFYLLINKILNKGANNPSVLNMLKTDVLTLFNYWWVAFNLEHIGDEIKRTARFLKQEKLKEDKINKIHETFLKIKETYLDSINSHYKKDKGLAMKAIVRKDSLIKMSDLLSRDKDSIVAKIGEKFKAIIGMLHQVNKIMIYNINPEM